MRILFLIGMFGEASCYTYFMYVSTRRLHIPALLVLGLEGPWLCPCDNPDPELADGL